jgi:hypothetical protein
MQQTWARPSQLLDVSRAFKQKSFSCALLSLEMDRMPSQNGLRSHHTLYNFHRLCFEELSERVLWAARQRTDRARRASDTLSVVVVSLSLSLSPWTLRDVRCAPFCRATLIEHALLCGRVCTSALATLISHRSQPPCVVVPPLTSAPCTPRAEAYAGPAFPLILAPQPAPASTTSPVGARLLLLGSSSGGGSRWLLLHHHHLLLPNHSGSSSSSSS